MIGTNPQSKVSSICIAVVGIIILSGIVATSINYEGRTDMECSISGDSIEYSFQTNYQTHYSFVSLDNGTGSDIKRYVALYDDEHVWPIPTEWISNALTHLSEKLARGGINLEIKSTDEIIGIMVDEIEGGAGNTKLIMMTGGLPVEIYNGTRECVFIDWMNSGGDLVWGNNTIGKYVCHAESTEHIVDADRIIFGMSGVTNTQSAYDEGRHDGSLADLLRIYYNNCSSGIREGMFEEFLSLGYSHDGYAAVSLMRFPGGDGNMTIFGGGVDHDTADYVAQTILSGINYQSKVIDYVMGHGSHASGTLEASETNPSLVMTLGLMNDYITEAHSFVRSNE